MNQRLRTVFAEHFSMHHWFLALFLAAGRDLELMGDEKDTWKVKTLDEILQEKKRRRELEEKTEPKRLKNVGYVLSCFIGKWRKMYLKRYSFIFLLMLNNCLAVQVFD